MIMDERLEFGDAAVLDLGGAATYLLGDVIDLEKARDIGQSDLYLVIQVDTTVTGGGGCTVNFKLASDAQAAIATDGSASVHVETGAIAVASLTAGKTYFLRIPPEGTVYEQYLGVLYTVAAAAVTAGKVNAFLTHDISRWKAYDNGVDY